LTSRCPAARAIPDRFRARIAPAKNPRLPWVASAAALALLTIFGALLFRGHAGLRTNIRVASPVVADLDAAPVAAHEGLPLRRRIVGGLEAERRSHELPQRASVVVQGRGWW
jgi:hypothetical protein